MLNHNYIGTEHILLGLIHEGEGVAAKALDSLGIDLDAVRQQVEEIVGQGQADPTGHIPFTPRAKKVLELALREGLQLGHNYIGTEHILLGLIREGEGVAAQVLQKLGADLDRVRQTVIQLLSGSAGGEGETTPAETEELSETGAWYGRWSRRPRTEPEDFPVCPSCSKPLAENLQQKEIPVGVGEGDVTRIERILRVTFCGRCGAALGIADA